MQTVSSAWTAEEKDSVRTIAQSLLVSWKKETNLANRTFTIGISTIGGPDGIGIDSSAIGGPGIYRYFNEKEYAMSLSWERGYNIPLGGLAKGLAEAELDNTSGRFTPRFMGGSSELYTTIIPRRPFLINAGFNFSGIDQSIPQFAGVVTKQPRVNTRTKRVNLQGADYIDFFQNRYLDQEVMFTGLRTDQVIEDLFESLGMSTAQYRLDYGINVIPFGLFEKGTRFSDAINDMVQAENGHLYQDEQGKFIFENRQHWDSAPYTQVQRVIRTAQVLESEIPNESNIINVVEINSKLVEKQPEQIIFRLNPFDSLMVPSNSSAEFFFEFESPALSLTTPTSTGSVSYFNAFSNSDGSGTELTDSLSVTKIYRFAHSAKVTFTNASTSNAYITNLVISGRIAKEVGTLYTRVKDSSSVTAYEERKISINNPYIQNETWAESLGQMILNDFSEIDNMQKITIRAIPELQIGDLISWQGRYWRIYDIKTKLDPDSGFTQDLTIVQKTIISYFRIGISTIGGSDQIAP